MSNLRKVATNILNPNAWRVLGGRRYLTYLTTFLGLLPAIARSGDLTPVDRIMGEAEDLFKFHGRAVHLDCAYCDREIQDGSCAFGLIREILIRDCYFRHLPPDALDNLDTVVDLGANRGVFSILAAAHATRVLSVEAKPLYKPVIEHLARLNGFENIRVEIAFVGAGGMDGADGAVRFDLCDLLDRRGFASVDLLKMDIEGSEFALFDRPDWLPRVRQLCMEVHRDYGDVTRITSCLNQAGFSLAFADSDMTRVDSRDDYDFLYAWR